MDQNIVPIRALVTTDTIFDTDDSSWQDPNARIALFFPTHHQRIHYWEIIYGICTLRNLIQARAETDHIQYRLLFRSGCRVDFEIWEDCRDEHKMHGRNFTHVIGCNIRVLHEKCNFEDVAYRNGAQSVRLIQIG
jgi:hypothetical protein